MTRLNVLESTGEVLELRTFIAEPRRKPEGPDTPLIFMSSLGAAPDFEEPYATEEASYAEQFSFNESLSDSPIQQACPTPDDGVAAQTLAVSFSTNAEGGAIRSWELIYESEGTEYTTGPVPWEMTLCGSATRLAELC